ncbi:MAG: aromatic ring-hydroxylating dioxygenase subunit alpha [Novosphingobium sp.]|nr:aromatic ring-hydroxylating dioxygenase subunit alpha [Novosphingobium sp.]MCP5404504.1 aromatic ring-hydroxylating dioxygenase subunit alpha [Novosphingobium sp.]
MRREPHPFTGVVYEEVGDGVVRVEDPAAGQSGLFKWDGTWMEGDLTYADPHMLYLVGGPDLPPGKDIFWTVLPPLDDMEAGGFTGNFGRSGNESVQQGMKVIGKFVGDPGQETDEGPRSAAQFPLDFFLENDRKPELIPEIFKRSAPMPGGPAMVPTARFFEKEYHDLEVRHIWKKCWQMVCREDDIPEVGDYHVYKIASLNYLVVRTGENEFRAYPNACLHRGRLLRETSGKRAKDFRCPYHGWSWGIDGELRDMPSEWDFAGVRKKVCKLPEAKVATWGGFIFINPDPEAISLEEYMGPEMIEHYAKIRLENRYKQADVVKVLRCNWKIAMEAFLEAYHVIATHPQLLLAGGDLADTRYDVFGNWGRLGHVNISVSSPHRGMVASKEQALEAYRQAADFNREYLRDIIGEEVEQFSDAELVEQTFNNLFPNFSPWGGWGRIVYRFRPNGDNPDECLMQAMLLAPWPKGKPKPPPRPQRLLGPDDPWTDAPELGTLAKIFMQDTGNVPHVQTGLKTKEPPYVWYSGYQESIIRNFHLNYDKALGLDEVE